MCNLSPDTDTLKCRQLTADGQSIAKNLPQEMVFGTASSYMDIDTSGSIRGRLYPNLYENQDSLNSIISTAIPTTPGRSYVLVVQGFKNEASCSRQTGTNPDGIPEYVSIQYPAALRANIRNSY